jgi:manganese/zinc/iron transport system ATP- binding protein
LLKAASGLLPACGGDIRIYGQAVGSCRHCVAYVPQHSQIDWKFPICVRKLVLTGRYVHLGWCQRPRQYDRDLVTATLTRLGLAAFADRQISQLSGGQQQRALLARALAQDADLFLLDEPLNAVDADTRKVIAEVLEELQRQGKTFIVATHDTAHLDRHFDSAVYLEGGREVPPPKGAFVGLQVGQSV